jgi:5-formyltetrahydrofolate cyclo-ligase
MLVVRIIGFTYIAYSTEKQKMKTKSTLRQQFLQKRLDLLPEDVQAKNEVIFSVIKGIFAKIRPGVIHSFLPHPAKNEVDTWEILHWIWEHLPDSETLAPYVIPGTREMEQYKLDANTALRPNSWQIPEPDPSTAEKVNEATIDVILVPLLAFDKKGSRIGYGGGYYDRFLAKCKPDTLKIGLCFFEPVDEIEDVQEYDIPLNMCVTPEYIYQF